MNILPISNVTPIYRVQSLSSTARYIPELPVDTFEHSQEVSTANNAVQNPTDIERSAYLSTQEHQDTISILTALQSQAEAKYKHQIDATGWCGRLADKISGLWGSKNRAGVVLEDLQQNRADIENLEISASRGNFRSEFFKTFGVNYNKTAIDEFQKEAQHYTLIKSAEQMADTATKELRKHMSFFEEHADSINPESPEFDKTKKHPDMKGALKQYTTSLEKFVGGKDNLSKLASAKRKDFDTLSMEEQLEVYNEISDSLIYTYTENVKQLKDGKTDKEIQKSYDEAYKKAFGTKNNIQKRVDKYVRAQQIKTVALQDMALSGFIGAAIAISGTSAPALLGAGITAVGTCGFDLSELATNNTDNATDLSKENVKDIVRCSLISGAEYFVGSKLYDIIPEAPAGKSLKNAVHNVARTLGIELSVAFAAEYARTGQWDKNQINPQTLIALTLATFATEEIVRMGLSAPSGLKSDCTPGSLSEDVADSITNASRKQLEVLYEANPAQVMNLKLLSVQNPDLYKDLLLSTLGGTKSAA